MCASTAFTCGAVSLENLLQFATWLICLTLNDPETFVLVDNQVSHYHNISVPKRPLNVFPVVSMPQILYINLFPVIFISIVVLYVVRSCVLIGTVGTISS